MRKGYLLVEILVVLAVMAMVGGIFDRFLVTFAFDLPRDSRLIQENITLCNAVSHIRTDVASAKTLSQIGVNSNEPNTLLVELPNGIVSYKFSNGRILRSFIGRRQGCDSREYGVGCSSRHELNGRYGTKARRVMPSR